MEGLYDYIKHYVDTEKGQRFIRHLIRESLAQLVWLGKNKILDEVGVTYNSILKSLRGIDTSSADSGYMTKMIKFKLILLGHDKNYRTRANRMQLSKDEQKEYGLCENYFINKIEEIIGKGKFVNHEWMFDLIWYKEEQDKSNEIRKAEPGKEYRLKRLVLALESEWAGKRRVDNNEKNDKDVYGAVKYDFQKLVVSNAENKVMIFQERGENLDEITKYIEDQINMFPMKKNDTILCVAYNKDYSDFRYRLFKKD